jgi:hypothetical protein
MDLTHQKKGFLQIVCRLSEKLSPQNGNPDSGIFITEKRGSGGYR